MGPGCGHKTKPARAQTTETVAPLPSTLDPTHIPDLSMWKPLGDIRPSFAGPHRGTFQRVYLNPIATRAMGHGTFNPWPEGSQLVKEALDKHRKRLGFFWMSKEQGEWVWATGDVNGKVAARFIGESSGACAACHAARAAQFGGTFSPTFAGKGTLDSSIRSGLHVETPDP